MEGSMQTAMVAHNPPGPIFQDHAEEYLECLTALARELDRAMNSIAANALPVFEDSVQRQLAICSQLSNVVARQTSRLGGEAGPFPVSTDEELNRRIAAATATLVTLNQRYSALLKHSGDTLQLLIGLVRCYTGYTQKEAGVWSNLRTWSSTI